MSMTQEEAIELLRDTPIDIRSTREDDIHTLYATAQMMAIDALRPVSRERIEQNKRRWEVQTSIFPYYYCSGCGESFEIHSYDKEKYRFCPYCMSPMTDEAVEITMRRLEALYENRD